ncbi:MAG: AraC family transcriptional regulator [Polaromonas sp.]
MLRLPPGWGGLPIDLFPIPAQKESGPAFVTCPMLLLATFGQGRRWHRYNGKSIELRTAPGMIELYGRDFQREGARWDGLPGQSIGVYLAPQVVTSLIRDGRDFDVVTTHELFDSKLQWLVQELLDEAQRGAPGGALYAEGLSLALLGRLAEFHRAPMSNSRAAGGLSAMSRQRVLDFIEAHSGHNLSVTVLAQEVGLSPHHFAHGFKESFGLPPHRFVQQRRMEKALKMLASSLTPVAEIALALGFSSQSHFTQVFRQHTGKTPAAARFP